MQPIGRFACLYGTLFLMLLPALVLAGSRTEQPAEFRLLDPASARHLPDRQGAFGVALSGEHHANFADGSRVLAATVEQIEANGALAHSPISVGDQIYAVNGFTFETLSDLVSYVRSLPPGSSASVTYFSASKKWASLTAKVDVGRRATAPAPPSAAASPVAPNSAQPPLGLHAFSGANRESKPPPQELQSQESGWPSVNTAQKPSGQASLSGDAQQCDRLAAHPWDTDRRAAGVDIEKIQVEQARDTCARALRENPDDPVLEFQFGRVLEASENYEDALRYYKSAAQKRYPAAFNNIGLWYLDRKDEFEAFKWFKAGAELGNPPSQFLTGKAYHLGLGTGWASYVTKDYREARYWYEQALKNGYTDAKLAMSALNMQPMIDVIGLFGAFSGGGGNPPGQEGDASGYTKDQQDQIESWKKAGEQGVPGYQGPLGAPPQ